MIHTHTGRTVDVGNLREEDVNPVDIAHALACINRYQGHAPHPYSVAQHSVLAAMVAPREHRLEALLHDAHEAYVGDVPRPLKRILPDYQALEARVAATVRRRFGLPEVLSQEVEEVDTRLLVTEAREFGMSWWETLGVEPFPAWQINLRPWPWAEAKAAFLDVLGKVRAAAG